MLHPTMLDDVGPTCWLRLNRRLDIIYCFNFILGLFRTDYLSRIRAQVFIGLTLQCVKFIEQTQEILRS